MRCPMGHGVGRRYVANMWLGSVMISSGWKRLVT